MRAAAAEALAARCRHVRRRGRVPQRVPLSSRQRRPPQLTPSAQTFPAGGPAAPAQTRPEEAAGARLAAVGAAQASQLAASYGEESEITLILFRWVVLIWLSSNYKFIM